MNGYDTYDYGARGYYPAMGRFMSVDPMAELYYNVSPYLYCKGNQVNMIDPTGMWVETDNGWSTSDPEDIQRFCDMADIEQTKYGSVTEAQIDQFITEEFNGTGGKLSDGSVLLSGIISYGDRKGNWNIPDYQMNKAGNQISNFGSFEQNQNNCISPFSIYSYKYYRERSWNEKGGYFPGLSIAGYVFDVGSNLLFNDKTWLNFGKLGLYSQGYYGNQFESVEIIAKAKGLAGILSKGVGLLGKAVSIYDMSQIYELKKGGYLTDFGAAYLEGSDALGIFGKVVGSAWSIGTTLGRSVVESSWYFNLLYGNKTW